MTKSDKRTGRHRAQRRATAYVPDDPTAGFGIWRVGSKASVTAVSSSAKYIGRVGGLAVALGIGVAIANNAGTAWADTDDSGSATKSTSSTTNGATTSTSNANSIGAKTDSTSPSTNADRPANTPGSAGEKRDSRSEAKHGRTGLTLGVRSASAREVRERLGTADIARGPDTSNAGEDGKAEASLNAESPASHAGTTNDPDASSSVAAPGNLEPLATDVTPTDAATPTAVDVNPTTEPQIRGGATTITTQPSAPTTPTDAPDEPESLALLAVLATSVREVTNVLTAAKPADDDLSIAPAGTSSSVAVADNTAAAAQAQDIAPAVAAVTSVLATPEQVAMEERAARLVKSPQMQVAKFFMKVVFFFTAQQKFAKVGGPDMTTMQRLDAAVDAWAYFAAIEAQNQNPLNPKVLAILLPQHVWAGISAGDSRNTFDNPDTIYRFIPMSSNSSYVITGRFAEGERASDTNFSVLAGLGGNTTSTLNADDIVVEADGTFRITVDRNPAAPGQTNHIQLQSNATGIIARDTLGDWSVESPTSLSVERVSGPNNNLFTQLGASLIPGIGPVLTNIGSTLANFGIFGPVRLPDFFVATQAAIIQVVGTLTYAQRWGGLATTDPATGALKPPNVLPQPTSAGSDTLETQLQSLGYFQLKDDEALVVTIDPGRAGYFVVPVTDDWGKTQNYWAEQTSLNNSQAVANPDGTYTLVISRTDPGVANWVSTGGLSQGTIFIRFQDLDTESTVAPTVNSQFLTVADLPSVLPSGTVYLTPTERQAQLAARKDTFDRRFAPYPQP